MRRQSRIIILLIIGIIFVFPQSVNAARGCCSNHGGVCGCNSAGRQVCCDNTLSPTCTCTPPPVYGCTDRNAKNYNYSANTNDGSCVYDVKGCMNEKASNYNKDATIDDGSCIIMGCKDKKAKNYNSEANQDDGSCQYEILGCTDPKATNYDAKANKDNGKCKYKKEKKKGEDKKTEEDNNNIEEKKENNNITDPTLTDVGEELTEEDMKDLLTFYGIANGVGLISIGGYLQNKKKKNKRKTNNNYCGKCGNKVTKGNYCEKCGNKIK